MLDVALKEWAVVCDLLLSGELALLLRKGGIHEPSGPGVFEMQHDRFALFPSWAHQKPEMIKEAYRDQVVVMDEPTELTFQGYAEPAAIWQVPSREAFDQLDDLHCWTKPQIDMRFSYKPDRPLYLVALRAYRLAEPKAIEMHWRYSGCKSWVPLESGHEVDDAGAVKVLDEERLSGVVQRVNGAFGNDE